MWTGALELFHTKVAQAEEYLNSLKLEAPVAQPAEESPAEVEGVPVN